MIKAISIKTLNPENSAHPLAIIFQKISRLKSAEKQIKQRLPKDLAEHCSVVSFESGKLLLSVPSNAWAMRLKFEQSDLLLHLRTFPEFSGLAMLGYFIAPPSDLVLKPVPKPQRMSENAQKTLASFAQLAPEGELKEKLQHMLKQQLSLKN